MDNHIEIYEKNTKTLAVYVSGISDLSVFVPYLTVKRRTSDTVPILSKTGAVSDASTTYVFNLTTVDTSILPGDYVFDISIESSTNKLTIVKDRFSVLDAVKY